jgi:ATP-binding cassette subfamily B protein
LLILAVILLGFGAVTFSLWVGGRDVIEGRISGGELTAFVFYAVLMASSGATVSELWGEIQRAAAAADRLGEVLAIAPSIAAPANPVPLPPAQGRVVFEAVTLRYPTRPDNAALTDFSLTVEPGEAIALVGPSGAGKTSVLSLLLRFYDPSVGRILLDGAEITRLDPRALRSRLGLVPQEPVIFSASIAENIRLGRPDATDAEVAAAAESCGGSRVHCRPAGWLWDGTRHARCDTFRRAAPTYRDCARHPARPQCVAIG